MKFLQFFSSEFEEEVNNLQLQLALVKVKLMLHLFVP